VLCCKNDVLLMMGGVGLPSTLLLQTAPERWRLLKAHGPAVGLPSEEDMGNSEVGHNALGAGRIFKQG
jgi:bisphosphoglycerate-independent phosphoglycerate mutase (AlkP superfamily)